MALAAVRLTAKTVATHCRCGILVVGTKPMIRWTNQQKAQIAVTYFRSRQAHCPLDSSLLHIEDATGDGDRSTVIVAYCPLCGNNMESSEVQDEIIAESCNDVPASARADSGDTTMSDAGSPRAFVSYSHDDNTHKRWVATLATRLRGDGVDVQLDQWTLVPGDQLPQYMESAIRDNSYVIIVCTPNYKLKSDDRKGGVGYEGDIMTAQVHTLQNHRKFVPILRSGTFETALPSWLAGKYGIDLSGEPYSEQKYFDLLNTLHNRREQPPPLGMVKP